MPLYDVPKDGRQGRTRTYVVSNVPGLQPGAFATQRHLTIEMGAVRHLASPQNQIL